MKLKRKVLRNFILKNHNKFISIGIALSVMMIFSLIQIGESLSLQYKSMLTSSFSYDIAIQDVTEQEEKVLVEYLEQQEDMESYGYEKDILWVDIPNHTEYKYSFLTIYKEGHPFPCGDINIVEGTIPKDTYEIGVDSEIAKLLGLSVGDKLDLPIHKSKKTLGCTVSAIYESLNLPEEYNDTTWILISNKTKETLENTKIPLETDTTALTVTISKGKYEEEKVEELVEILRSKINSNYDKLLKKVNLGEVLTKAEQKQYEGIQGKIYENVSKKEIIEDSKIADKQFYLLIVMSIIIAISMILLIYNNISLLTKKRMYDYSILRCIGMNRKYLGKMLWIEIVCYACIGIVLGLLLGNVLNTLVANKIIFFITGNDARVIQTPYSYLISIGISIVAIVIANLQILLKIKRISPIEGLKYQEDFSDFFIEKSRRKKTKKKKTQSKKKILSFIAKRNMERNFSKSIIVILSLMICMTLLFVIAHFGATMNFSLSGVDSYKQEISNYETYIEAGTIAYNNPEAKNEKYIYPERMGKDIFIPGISQQYRFNDLSYCVTDATEGDFLAWGGKMVLFDDAMIQKLQEDNNALKEIDTSKEILIYVSFQDYELQNINGIQAENNCYIDEKQGVNLEITGVDNIDNVFTEHFILTACLKDVYLSDQKWDQNGQGYFIANEKLVKRLYGTVGYNHILFDLEEDNKETKESIKEMYVENVEGAIFNNYKLGSEEDQRMLKGVICLLAYLVAATALVGFSNMSNTIQANLVSRRKENGIMRALGMSKKMQETVILKENIRMVTYALLASTIIGFLVNTTIALAFFGIFMCYWYVYVILAVLFYNISIWVIKLTLKHQHQVTIIENLMGNE